MSISMRWCASAGFGDRSGVVPHYYSRVHAVTASDFSFYIARSAMRRLALAFCFVVASAGGLSAQRGTFTHADTLRGTNGPGRSWWDATFYDLHVTVSLADSSIRGYNGITYRVIAPAKEMQIDLQVPMQIDSIIQDGRALTARRDSNAFFVTMASPQRVGDVKTVTVFYHGRPRAAKRPPWDGGFIWRQDSLGHPWVATANEGLGASVWWPNKDIPADEPDSQRIAITVPDSMTDVSNGRLRSTTRNGDGNAGTYAHWTEIYKGENGDLTMDFWPLAYHLDTAKVQWQQATSMLSCFEHWFGPYPWYADGYKLIEAPHLGMEHQSGVAYGNHFKNGYLGRDLSATGHGLKWDFIVVHESAHEWWGNSLTDKDHADMWIHESFANYSESLYTECQQGKAAGAEYVIGTRRLIKNDRPIVGHFGVNDEGSEDMYYKGGNMLHTIRQVVDDDDKWRSILRGLQQTFWHQTVSGTQVEDYMSHAAGIDLSKVFAQYLTTTQVPVLEYALNGGTLKYRWTNVVPGFAMPVKVTVAPERYERIRPTESWQTMKVKLASAAEFKVDENYYVTVRPAAPKAGIGN